VRPSPGADCAARYADTRPRPVLMTLRRWIPGRGSSAPPSALAAGGGSSPRRSAAGIHASDLSSTTSSNCAKQASKRPRRRSPAGSLLAAPFQLRSPIHNRDATLEPAGQRSAERLHGLKAKQQLIAGSGRCAELVDLALQPPPASQLAIRSYSAISSMPAAPGPCHPRSAAPIDLVTRSWVNRQAGAVVASEAR
jgi:hypothetical protein